ncbi:ABC transporter substrate-binding protein [Chloroflexota bacterium]
MPLSTSTPAPAPSLTPLSTGPYGELGVAVATFSNGVFDPVQASVYAAMYMSAPMFDFLVRTDPPERISMGIAERWELDPNGLSWTFYIRKGIRFHNGSALTAHDVKFTLDRYASKDAFYPHIRDIQEGVEVIDDYAVRVYTKGPQPFYWRFVSFIAGTQGAIIPKDYFEKVGKDRFNFHPVGSGPFRFVRHIPGDMVEYEALDKHYRQVPAFKKLTIMVIPKETTRVAMLKTGEVDIIEVGVDAVAQIEVVGLRAVTLAGSQALVHFYGAYDPRAKGMPTADARVREALSLAINRDEIGRNLFSRKLQPPMPPSMWLDQPEIDVPYWRDYCAQFYRFDPEEAKRLLKEAGYSHGFAIKLYSYILAGVPYLSGLAQVIQGNWQEIGVKAEIVHKEWEAMEALWRSGPNRGPAAELVGQVSIHGTDGHVMPARAIMGYYWSKGTRDLIQGGVPELDSMVEAALIEPSNVKRREIIAKALHLAMDSRVCSVIGTVPKMAGLGPRVDIDFPTTSRSILQYVETAKHRK